MKYLKLSILLDVRCPQHSDHLASVQVVEEQSELTVRAL